MVLGRHFFIGLFLFLASQLLADDKAPSPHIKLVLFQKGLKNPTVIADDGTGRIFVVEEEGKIRLLENGQVRPQAYLDITDRVCFNWECGFLGLAFHPDFAHNGRFFVNYVTKVGNQLQTVVSEFKANPADKKVDPATERVILRFDQPFWDHKAGQLAFGKDGMLYIATGDGGSGGDPQNNGQNLHTFLAKILRIDVDHKQPYEVPPDNPFVNQAGAYPENWAYGLRNPWRFSFDRGTGTLYCADVGQDKWEELDIIEKGKNYGWSAKEGTHDFKPERGVGQLVDPIIEYPHTEGNICIIGGYVYRGKQFPALQGIYFYGDWGSGRIWGLKWDGKSVTMNAELMPPQDVHMSSFGEDKDGELYVLDYNNGVAYRLAQ